MDVDDTAQMEEQFVHKSRILTDSAVEAYNQARIIFSLFAEAKRRCLLSKRTIRQEALAYKRLSGIAVQIILTVSAAAAWNQRKSSHTVSESMRFRRLFMRTDKNAERPTNKIDETSRNIRVQETTHVSSDVRFLSLDARPDSTCTQKTPSRSGCYTQIFDLIFQNLGWLFSLCPLLRRRGIRWKKRSSKERPEQLWKKKLKQSHLHSCIWLHRLEQENKHRRW